MHIKDSLRKLLDDLPMRNLAKIARQADVPYWPLREWHAKRVDKLDVDYAHKLHIHLTGYAWEVKGGKKP